MRKNFNFFPSVLVLNIKLETKNFNLLCIVLFDFSKRIKFSRNQIVRIRSDDRTTREIEREFGQVQNEEEKV